jgi:hypothetical protein
VGSSYAYERHDPRSKRSYEGKRPRRTGFSLNPGELINEGPACGGRHGFVKRQRLKTER